GNIGLALSREVKGLGKDSWVAAEVSSYQMEGIKDFCPDVAVVLNLTPDHMERHKTMEEYGRCKRNVFINQTAKQVTVLNYDDPEVRTWGKYSKGTLCYFSRNAVLPEGVYMKDGSFFVKWKNKTIEICHKSELQIFGAHNEENVLAAIACGFFAGVTPDDMRKTLLDFKGVEHRIEFVATVNGVPYYNDSKATNTDSVIKALEAFPSGHIVLLAGGHDKMTPLEPMMNLIREKADMLILLGEARERFYQAAVTAGVENVVMADGFEAAVETAYKNARPPQVVLLSPACSSYDMFNNFEERGRYFKKLVHELE
ncbi:MAG: UDP-N-acetylmuramoyl-L-alanine--D-glutamate ligase, partial [Acidaminococcaceae bacterium]|nr:UDP-N-acetylmuramoyl-L-alanine--D-glutamate ligase [Acidaminococcaceae bacterium]